MFLAIKKYPLIFIFALFTTGFLTFLGFWQYDKGQQRELSDRLHSESFSKQQISLNELKSDTQLKDGIKVSVTGRFVKDMVIFHDNRLNFGWSGYHVFSVFSLSDDKAVLINRGWVKMNVDRHILPSVITSDEYVTLEGVIRFPVKGVFTLAEEELKMTFPQRVQTIEVDKIKESTQYPLQEYSVLLDANVIGEHFDRNWLNLLPGKYMSANKHYAYSLQWFSLAFIGLIIFMILIFKMAKNEQG